MAYSIKRHEVDRLLSMVVWLGWSLAEESYENGSIVIKLRKELSKEVLAAAGELEKKSSPQ